MTAFSGVFVYKLFLTLVSEYSPILAEELHESRKIKPVVCTGVRVREGGSPLRKGVISPGKVYRASITCLNDELSKTFLELLGVVMHKPFRLPACNVTITDLSMEVKDHYFFADNATGDVECFQIFFIAPTQLGKMVSWRPKTPIFRLFPVAEYVLRNLANHWNAFAPDDLKVNPDEVFTFSQNFIYESKYSLRSEPIFLGEGRVTIGFTGWCEYRIAKKEPETCRLIEMLLRYAEYVGVGKHRNLGLGETRVKVIYSLNRANC